MNDYLRVSGELKGELEYELTVNGMAPVSFTVAAGTNNNYRFQIDAAGKLGRVP